MRGWLRLAAKLLQTEVGVPPYVTFGDLRNGSAGLAGYLGTGYNPFVIEGGGGGGKGFPRLAIATLAVPLMLPTVAVTTKLPSSGPAEKTPSLSMAPPVAVHSTLPISMSRPC